MPKKTVSILDVPPNCYKDFSCGVEELDKYLQRFAKGNHKKGIGKTFVLKEAHSVIGYYTISMGSIEFSSVPDNKKLGLPKYPIPTAKIGRLAIDERAKGTGKGKLLLIDAFHRIYEASQIIASFGIIVDAKNEAAKQFYKHFGFIECHDSHFSLFLPLQTIQSCFE